MAEGSVIPIQRVAAVTALLLAAGLCRIPPAWGDDAPTDDQTVIEISVRGARRMSDDAVLAHVMMREGSRFSEKVARADQRRLMETGRFDNVVVVKAPTTEGLVVTFVVTERKLISAVLLRGAKSISQKKLRNEISIGADDPVDPSRIALARMALEDFYLSKGYYFAAVTVDAAALRNRLQVVFVIVEGPKVAVKSVDFDFETTQSFSKYKLRRQIKTKRAIWLLTLGKLDRPQLARDVASVRNFYRDEGYLDAEVSSKLTFNPAKDKASVTFLVNEGPRYRIGEIRFVGATVFSDAELLKRVVMVPGRYYNALELRRDVETLQDTFGEVGYVDARVGHQTVFSAPDEDDETRPAKLIIQYHIHEGDLFRLGRVTIRGNDITKDHVIRRQMTMYPGQMFNTLAMKKGERQLGESRLFARAALSPYGGDENTRNLLVDIEEGQTAELTFGAGFSTNSGLVGTIRFLQRNFSWTEVATSWADIINGRGSKGDGQTLQVALEVGDDVSRGKINWREPFLFDRPIGLGAGLFTFEREREKYTESSSGAMVSLGKLFKNRWYSEMAARVAATTIDDFKKNVSSEARADAGSHTTVSFQGMLVRDLTDSRWQPASGDHIRLSAQQFAGDYSFTELSLAYKHYWTTHIDALDRKHIIAIKGNTSFILGDAPIWNRLYGGGIGSVRGFRFRGIGPRSADADNDDPIGGDFLAYVGAEYSAPLVADTLRYVVFIDSGTVEKNVSVETWRVSVGAGIRLLIPMMGPVPVSLDIAWPIEQDPADRTEQISFSIGWTF